MIEHAVQHDADAALFAFLDQLAELLFGAEGRVDLHEVARVVAVVGKGAEDGIQVQDTDVQALQIIELFDDAADIAAEKVVIEHFPFAVHAVFGRFVPALMQPFFGRDLYFAAAVKAIREDLIHDPAFEPIGRAKIFVVYQDLIRRNMIGEF